MRIQNPIGNIIAEIKDLVHTLKDPIESPTRKTLYYTWFSEGLMHIPEIHYVVSGGSGNHRINVGRSSLTTSFTQ